MHYVAIQNTYTELQIALFHHKKIVATVSTDKTTASKLIIILLQNLLTQEKIAFQDISFIGVNQGPGPFNTLRVVIATANGLSFASGKPLIGVNALHALLGEYPKNITTVALLNAFSQDLYFAIRKPNDEKIIEGYKSVNALINELSFLYQEPLCFIGNGALLYKDMIIHALGQRAYFPEIITPSCSLEYLGTLACEQWQKKENITDQIQPLYFKSFEPTQDKKK